METSAVLRVEEGDHEERDVVLERDPAEGLEVYPGLYVLVAVGEVADTELLCVCLVVDVPVFSSESEVLEGRIVVTCREGGRGRTSTLQHGDCYGRRCAHPHIAPSAALQAHPFHSPSKDDTAEAERAIGSFDTAEELLLLHHFASQDTVNIDTGHLDLSVWGRMAKEKRSRGGRCGARPSALA